LTPRFRILVFLVPACVLAVVFVTAVSQLPASGTFAGEYGETLNHVAPVERHSTDVVTAVNFDYRGIDTLGEEFILFASASGTVLLLRMHGQEKESKGSDREEGERLERDVPPTSNAVRLLGLGLVGVSVVFGLYIVSHGQVTPGGGFQGGVILATAPLLAYLAGGADVFKRIAPEHPVSAGEALGATLYVATGLAGVIVGGAFLQNVLPAGKSGSIDSAGTIAILNPATGLEVAAGFVLILTAFLAEMLKIDRSRGGRGGGEA